MVSVYVHVKTSMSVRVTTIFDVEMKACNANLWMANVHMLALLLYGGQTFPMIVLREVICAKTMFLFIIHLKHP